MYLRCLDVSSGLLTLELSPAPGVSPACARSRPDAPSSRSTSIAQSRLQRIQPIPQRPILAAQLIEIAAQPTQLLALAASALKRRDRHTCRAYHPLVGMSLDHAPQSGIARASPQARKRADGVAQRPLPRIVQRHDQRLHRPGTCAASSVTARPRQRPEAMGRRRPRVHRLREIGHPCRQRLHRARSRPARPTPRRRPRAPDSSHERQSTCRTSASNAPGVRVLPSAVAAAASTW